MGFSELTTVFVPSIYHFDRNHVIDSVAIHTMAGKLSAEQCGKLFQEEGRRASSNYGIDSDGVIGGYVDEDERAKTTSSPGDSGPYPGVDSRAITIEVASLTASEPFQPSDEAYESLLKLLVDICQRHNISSLKWKDDKDYALAAASGGPVDEQNMFVHKWFAAKSCPGEWLYTRQGEIAAEVNKRIANGETYTDSAASASSSSSSTSTSSSGQSVSVNYEALTPYIVTLSRDTVVDYSILKDAGVVGAIVEAGYWFNADGSTVQKFDNPNLATQVSELEKINMLYGLYMDCRAKNTVEAKEEIYHLSFPARKYDASLGIWLNLNISDDSQYNTPILKQYRTELERLGLKGKMGIRCTRDFIEHIEWTTGETFKDDFYLWLDEHITDTSELDGLLDPTFFDIDGYDATETQGTTADETTTTEEVTNG